MAIKEIFILLALTVLTSQQVVGFLQRQPQPGQQQQQQQQQPQATSGSQSLEEESGQQHPAPEPYSFAYSAESNGGLSTHQERGDGTGRVTGFYTIQDADGRERRVDYVADENGYRANVRTNEVGTRSEAAADAQYTVQLPSAKQLEAAKISYEQYKYLEDQYQAERERTQQARARHQSVKQQAKQHAARFNQLANGQQVNYSSAEQVQRGSAASLNGQSNQQATFVAANSFSAQSGGNSNVANIEFQGNSQFGAASPIQASGGEVAGEQELYENSWRQSNFAGPTSAAPALPNQSVVGVDTRQTISRGQSSGSATVLNQPNTLVGYAAANQQQVNSNQQDGRKSGQFNANEQFAANNDRTIQQVVQQQPQLQQQEQQQQQQQQQQQAQVTQEPAWKTAVRLGGTTKRPITVLQRQLEQQFMQVATQLTDQDYPRQTQTTAAPLARTSELPQVSLIRQNEGQQQQQQQRFEAVNTALNSGYNYGNSNIEQPATTIAPERPQIPQVWTGTTINGGQAPYQINQLTGVAQQNRVVEDQAQLNQQQNNIINEDTQIDDERPDQVNLQENNVQSFQQSQQPQEQTNLIGVTKVSENVAVNVNPTAPNGFVSINLSESDAVKEEPVTFAPAIIRPSSPKPQELFTATSERPQFEAKQEEVSVIAEPVNSLNAQQQVVQQQQQANFQEQKTIPQQVTTTFERPIISETVTARPNSVNQIIENITRQPLEFITPAQQKVVAEQRVVVQAEAEEATKTRQPARFTGMIMRSSIGTTSTAAPVTYRQEVSTTTTASAPLIRQQEATVSSTTGRLSDKFYQPTTTTTRLPSSPAEPVLIRQNKEQVDFGSYGVKGGGKIALSLPGPRRISINRFNLTKANETRASQLQSFRTTTESPQTRQTIIAITTKAPARNSQVEFVVKPQQKQINYSQLDADQSSNEYKSPNISRQQQQTQPQPQSQSQSQSQPRQQQQQQQLPQTTTAAVAAISTDAIVDANKRQQWKGIKGGSWNGPKKQFWQSGSGSLTNVNERSQISYLSPANRSQAPTQQINQSSRLASANYAADNSSSAFGSRIVTSTSS